MTIKGLLKVWSLAKSNLGNLGQTTPLMVLYVSYSFHPQCLDETSTLWGLRQNNCHGDVIKGSMAAYPMVMSALLGWRNPRWFRSERPKWCFILVGFQDSNQFQISNFVHPLETVWLSDNATALMPRTSLGTFKDYMFETEMEVWRVLPTVIQTFVV